MAWKDKTTIAPKYFEGGTKQLAKKKTPATAKVVVVGAGAFGGWTALHLLRKGFSVTLYDAWGAGNARSSSGGETRLMRCVYGDNALYTQMALDSYELWEQLEAATGQTLLVPTGNLWFAGAESADLDRALPVMDSHGLPYEILQPAEAEARFPHVYTGDLKYVLLEKKTGYLKAREACRLVQEQFVKEGGTFYQQGLFPAEVAGGSMKHGRAADGSVVSADLFVFACGPWLGQLFPRQLGSLLQVTRQEVFYFGPPLELSAYLEGNIPTWIDMAESGGFYGIPGGVNRGFKVASDIRGRQIDPTTEVRTPTGSEIERAAKYLSFRFPALKNAPLVESRVCQYTNTADGNFILDQHPEAANVWLLGGGSGHGFKHGPALGRLAADVVAGEKELPFILSADRF